MPRGETTTTKTSTTFKPSQPAGAHPRLSSRCHTRGYDNKTLVAIIPVGGVALKGETHSLVGKLGMEGGVCVCV